MLIGERISIRPYSGYQTFESHYDSYFATTSGRKRPQIKSGSKPKHAKHKRRKEKNQYEDEGARKRSPLQKILHPLVGRKRTDEKKRILPLIGPSKTQKRNKTSIEASSQSSAADYREDENASQNTTGKETVKDSNGTSTAAAREGSGSGSAPETGSSGAGAPGGTGKPAAAPATEKPDSGQTPSKPDTNEVKDKDKQSQGNNDLPDKPDKHDDHKGDPFGPIVGVGFLLVTACLAIYCATAAGKAKKQAIATIRNNG